MEIGVSVRAARAASVRRLLPGGALLIDPALTRIPEFGIVQHATQGRLSHPRVAPSFRDGGILARPDEAIANGVAARLIDRILML
jgi:hypothetical protein